MHDFLRCPTLSPTMHGTTDASPSTARNRTRPCIRSSANPPSGSGTTAHPTSREKARGSSASAPRRYQGDSDSRTGIFGAACIISGKGQKTEETFCRRTDWKRTSGKASSRPTQTAMSSATSGDDNVLSFATCRLAERLPFKRGELHRRGSCEVVKYRQLYAQPIGNPLLRKQCQRKPQLLVLFCQHMEIVSDDPDVIQCDAAHLASS